MVRGHTTRYAQLAQQVRDHAAVLVTTRPAVCAAEPLDEFVAVVVRAVAGVVGQVEHQLGVGQAVEA